MPYESAPDPRPDDAAARGATVLGVEYDETQRTLAVVLDDGTRLELAPDAPEARGITPGLRLAAAERAGLEAAASRKQIAREIFAMLDRRARTRTDLRQRLVARGHSEQSVDRVLDRCVSEGLVDDLAFARGWAQAQLRRRGVGRRWLHARLLQLGVDEAQVRRVLDEIHGETDEVEQAVRALATRRLDLEVEAQRRRAFRFLQSRGFSSRASLGALDRARRAARAED